MLRIRWLLRSRLVALFSFKALRSPATLQKLLHSFSVACALKIQRKSFTAADTHLTASAAALKLKIAIKSWSLVLQSLPRVLELLKSRIPYENTARNSLIEFPI